jgi:hypothetical protein
MGQLTFLGEFWTTIIMWCIIYVLLPTYLLIVGIWYLWIWYDNKVHPLMDKGERVGDLAN